MLCRLGATANYRGFSYTAYAVLLCVQQQDRLLLVTKWLYPDVAKRYGTNWKAVERNIRDHRGVGAESCHAGGTGPPSAASAPLRGAVPVHPVQQPPVRAEGGTGAELKRNIKRGRADPGVHPGVPRRLFCFGRCRPTTQGGGRRRSGGRGSSDNALFPPCGDLLRCKAEELVDLIVVLAQQGSAAPHIGVRL